MIAFIKHLLNELEVKRQVNKRDKQREYRKKQIIEIGLDQFINKGYYGTSTREIAKIAGVSSGLMFHYFNSKKSLYETLIEIGCSKMNLPPGQGMSPIKFFEQQVRDFLQLITSSPFAAKMFVFMGYAVYNAAQISKKAGDLLAEHDIVSDSVPLIQQGQALGEIRSGDPLALSITFWSSIQGVAEAIALNQNYPAPEAEWILDILKKD